MYISIEHFRNVCAQSDQNECRIRMKNKSNVYRTENGYRNRCFVLFIISIQLVYSSSVSNNYIIFSRERKIPKKFECSFVVSHLNFRSLYLQSLNMISNNFDSGLNVYAS